MQRVEKRRAFFLPRFSGKAKKMALNNGQFVMVSLSNHDYARAGVVTKER